jgi:hypothetical protein
MSHPAISILPSKATRSCCRRSAATRASITAGARVRPAAFNYSLSSHPHMPTPPFFSFRSACHAQALFLHLCDFAV